MSLTRERSSTSRYDYRSPFPSPETEMEPAGKIFPGRDGELQVQMVEKVRIGRDGGRTLIYGKSEPLTQVWQRDAEEMDAKLREHGYLPKLPREANQLSHPAILR